MKFIYYYWHGKNITYNRTKLDGHPHMLAFNKIRGQNTDLLSYLFHKGYGTGFLHLRNNLINVVSLL